MSIDRDSCVVAHARVTGARADGQFELSCDAAAGCRTCRGACCFLSASPAAIALRLGQVCSVGDSVRIELPATRLLRAAAAVYGLPLAGLALGALAGQAIGASDAACLIGASGGLGGACCLLARINPRLERYVLAGLGVRAS